MSVKALIKSMVPASLQPQALLTAEVRRHTGLTVQDGPFKGMSYIDVSVGSQLVPKLLGIYERELNAAVESMIRFAPDTVIDIGAAEGYFAVGVARRLQRSKIHAFEMTDFGRQKIAELARKNGVLDRIQIDGKCEPENLAAAMEAPGRLAVICDVEGYEARLLDPVAVPKLLGVPILVELHEFAVPGIGAMLRERFGASHAIEEIFATQRSVTEYPYASMRRRLMPRMYIEYIVNEARPGPMSWLWMTPSAGQARAGEA